MTESVRIGRPGAELVLERGRDLGRIGDLRVTLHFKAMTASAIVSDMNDFAHLARLVADLAESWRGWEGTKRWESTEGQLQVSCSHDGLGNVAVRIGLRPELDPDSWRAEATAQVDAGQLEDIANALHRLLDRV